jgi:ABC-type multidrug transport system fused ATPase/permease subunit
VKDHLVAKRRNTTSYGIMMQDKSEMKNDEYTFEEFIDGVVDILGDLTSLYDIEEEYISRFKFFTPYEDFVDFSYTLASPVIETFILAVQTVLAAIITALAPIACLAFLVVGVVALFFDEELAIETFSLAAVSAYAFFSFAYLTTMLALATAIEPIVRTTSIITRTSASFLDMCIGEDEEVNLNEPRIGV